MLLQLLVPDVVGEKSQKPRLTNHAILVLAILAYHVERPPPAQPCSVYMPPSADLPVQKTPPILPDQLVEDIIGNAVRKLHSDDDRKSISSIALTSYACRIQANRVRFAKLSVFMGRPGSGHSIHTLATVTKAGRSVTTIPGVCAFVTSLELDIRGDDNKLNWRIERQSAFDPFPVPDTLRPVHWDGAADILLAYILNDLFRPSSPGSPSAKLSTGQCTLTLRFSTFSASEFWDPADRRLSWTLLSPELQTAFENMFRASQLHKVQLSCFQDVTQSLLTGGKIKHINLYDASILQLDGHRDSRDDVQEWEAVSLKSLQIDQDVTPTDLGIISPATSNIPAPPCYLFPILTTLSVFHASMWKPEIYQVAWTVRILNDILRNSPCLASLCINIINFHASPGIPIRCEDDMGIQYGHLTHLKSITCVLSSTVNIPLIPFLLKDRVPQNVREIIICPGALYAHAFGEVLPEMAGDGVPEKVDLGFLDTFFAGHSFGGVERIVIEFKIRINPSIDDKGRLVDEYRDSKIRELRLLRETGRLDCRVRV